MYDDWRRSSSLASAICGESSFVPSDYSNDMPAAGGLIVGGTVGGIIEAQAAGGWFEIELVDGRTYAIDLEGCALATTVLPELPDANI